MYFFQTLSRCIHVINYVNFTDNLWYRGGMLCTLQETGDVGGLNPSTSRTVTLDVHDTGFPPNPYHLQLAGVGPHTPVFGSKLTSTALGFCWRSRSCP